ncbi:hypothetical protein KUA12_11170 [Komagataeibacter oboediens]|nr:hypothetical protein [Komagataeibacter oboediens]
MAQRAVARVANRYMPRAARAVALPVQLAPLLGAAVACTILSVASWRWIFLLNLPFGLRTSALIAFLYGTDHVRQTAGQATLPLFILHFHSARQKGDHALIDLRLFRVPAFSVSAMMMFLINGVSFAG